MSESTVKFLVIDGVRFAQVPDEDDESSCNRCAFHRTGPCSVPWEEEQAQGMDCVLDGTHYEVVE